jgi:hypothetical protein
VQTTQGHRTFPAAISVINGVINGVINDVINDVNVSQQPSGRSARGLS